MTDKELSSLQLLKSINWLLTTILSSPLLGLMLGIWFVPLRGETFIPGIIQYIFTDTDITAGYHVLCLQYFIASWILTIRHVFHLNDSNKTSLILSSGSKFDIRLGIKRTPTPSAWSIIWGTHSTERQHNVESNGRSLEALRQSQLWLLMGPEE